MAQDEFQQRARRWLSAYKQEVLGVAEDGIWLRNGKRYSHILPQEKYRLSILPSFRDQFWEWFGKQRPRIQLHSDFHHLNSSQALCFNLFFPPMMGDGHELAQFSSVMGIAGVPNAEASFEFQPSPTEGTCIDFSMLLRSGGRVNFEIKYTESEFGSAKADPAHLDKFESIYKSRLAERSKNPSVVQRSSWRTTRSRDVWRLNESAGDIAIFLFPNENTRLENTRRSSRVVRLSHFDLGFESCIWKTSFSISSRS